MQLSLNLDPILQTKNELYKGWKIVAYKRQKPRMVREGVTERYRQRYNQNWSEFKVEYYFETYIYKPKHPNNGQGVCGIMSGCWNIEIAIECTKTYIDNFFSKGH